jgi:Bifunctional DNA primase/polymerase, N-terminal
LSLSETNPVVKLDTGFALDVAAWFVTGGTPLVLAHKRRGHAFALEAEWQHTEPDMRNYWRWLNGDGDMLAIVTGHVYDVFDFDTQNGGDLREFLAYWHSLGHDKLTVQAISATPSGGVHLYVNTLNKRKQPIARGIDYQGRNGIAFIPPSRKLSKVTNESVSYRWLEWSPGGTDDGAAVHAILDAWPEHRPVFKPAANSLDHAGLSRADVKRYIAEGIPDDEPHDSTLALITFYLVKWHIPPSQVRNIWEDIVARTPEKNGRRPYEDRDFNRHYSGAERKLRGA